MDALGTSASLDRVRSLAHAYLLGRPFAVVVAWGLAGASGPGATISFAQTPPGWSGADAAAKVWVEFAQASVRAGARCVANSWSPPRVCPFDALRARPGGGVSAGMDVLGLLDEGPSGRFLVADLPGSRCGALRGLVTGGGGSPLAGRCVGGMGLGAVDLGVGPLVGAAPVLGEEFVHTGRALVLDGCATGACSRFGCQARRWSSGQRFGARVGLAGDGWGSLAFGPGSGCGAVAFMKLAVSGSLKRWALGLVWVLALLGLVYGLRDVQMHVWRDRVQSVPVWAWLSALALWQCSLLCRAWRLRDEWLWRQGMSLWQTWRMTVLHNAAVLLMPLRAGEMGYPWMLQRALAVSWIQAWRSLVWLRLQDALVLLGLGVLLGIQVPVYGLLLAALAWVLVWRRGVWLLKSRHPLARRLRPWMHRRGTDSGWWLSLANWLCKLTAVALLLELTLGGDATLNSWRAMQGALGGELAALLPIQGPAGLGTYEGAVWLALQPLSLPLEEVVQAVLTVHVFCLIVSLLPAALVGLWAIWSGCAVFVSVVPAPAGRKGVHE